MYGTLPWIDARKPSGEGAHFGVIFAHTPTRYFWTVALPAVGTAAVLCVASRACGVKLGWPGLVAGAALATGVAVNGGVINHIRSQWVPAVSTATSGMVGIATVGHAGHNVVAAAERVIAAAALAMLVGVVASGNPASATTIATVAG